MVQREFALPYPSVEPSVAHIGVGAPKSRDATREDTPEPDAGARSIIPTAEPAAKHTPLESPRTWHDQVAHQGEREPALGTQAWLQD